MHLLPKVFRTEGDMVDFDPSKILESLMKETGLSEDQAKYITELVVRRIISSSIKFLSGPHIREIVCSILSEQHYEQERKLYTRIGMPLMDYEEFLEKGNAGNPERIHHWAANQLSEEYALLRILNDEESKAHLFGDIHIHMLKYFDLRPLSQNWDPRLILKNGLPPVNITGFCKSGPANNLGTAIHHLSNWLGMVQGEFSENQGFDFLTTFLSPYSKGLSDNEVKINLQNLIFEINQLSGLIGRDFPFTSISCTPVVLNFFSEVPAIGPNGEVVGVYGDYNDECLRLFNILAEIYTSGDFYGNPFEFPKRLIFYSNDWIYNYKEQYNKIWEEIYKMKTPYIVNFCSNWLQNKVSKQYQGNGYKNYGILQNICLNLPRYAYISKNEEKFFEILEDMLNLSANILLKKYNLIKRRLTSKHLPLCSGLIDNNFLFDIEKQNLAISFVGLNEAVKFLTDSELHESPDSFKFGVNIVKKMKEQCEKLSEINNKNITLMNTNSEKIRARFAKSDLLHFKNETKLILNENQQDYTNSVHFRETKNLNLYDRIRMQGEFHELIQNNVNEFILLKEVETNFNQLLEKICNQTKIGTIKFI